MYYKIIIIKIMYYLIIINQDNVAQHNYFYKFIFYNIIYYKVIIIKDLNTLR